MGNQCINCRYNGGRLMIESKKFKDIRTGEIVTTFMLTDIQYMEEV